MKGQEKDKKGQGKDKKGQERTRKDNERISVGNIQVFSPFSDPNPKTHVF
jgi:hypothetical protein